MTQTTVDEQGRLHRTDGPARLPGWFIHGHDISQEVNEWIEINELSWPWDKETQMLFELRFVHIDRPEIEIYKPGSPQDIINRIRQRQQQRSTP